MDSLTHNNNHKKGKNFVCIFIKTEFWDSIVQRFIKLPISKSINLRACIGNTLLAISASTINVRSTVRRTEYAQIIVGFSEVYINYGVMRAKISSMRFHHVK